MPQAVTALAGLTIINGGMAPDKFGAVLDALGPLPHEGQREPAERLVGGVGVYRFRITTKRPQPAAERHQLERVSHLAGCLLEQMGVDDPQALGANPATAQPRSAVGSRLLVELYKIANERRPATATLGAHERWTALLLLLSDLKEAAERCAPMASQRSPRVSKRRGRGGKGRDGQEPKGDLLHTLFEAYAALRLRFPESGPPLACDKKLRAFVRAALALAASSAPPMTGAIGLQYEDVYKACGPDLSQTSATTDAAIRLAFSRWKAQTKAR